MCRLRLTDPQADPIRELEFMKKWTNAVGDTFASQLSLNLLSVCQNLYPCWTLSNLLEGELLSFHVPPLPRRRASIDILPVH
jgi:hypothetical protein